LNTAGVKERAASSFAEIVRTEAQRDDVIVTVYLLGRHHRDPRQLLAVAEQEGAGDPVGEFQGVIVEEAGD